MAGEEDLGTGSVTITLDSTAADAGLSRLQDRIERALYQAAVDGTRRMERQINSTIRRINPIKLQVEADTSRFQRSLNNLNNVGNTRLGVVPDVDRTEFVRRVQAALAGATVSIGVTPDMTGFNAAVARHRVPPIDVRVDADVDTNRFTRAMSGLGKVAGTVGKSATAALKFGAIGIAAASAAQSVIGLTAALAPAVGILAAAPAAALTYASVLGTLKLATAGVGDAFSAALSGNAEKFSQAIAGLSPAAKGAAKEVRALKPAFDGLRKSVQNALFAPLAGQITATAKALQGPLKAGLTGISAQFGAAAKQALLFAQSSSAVGGVSTVLAVTKSALNGLAGAVQPLLKGFLDIGSAVAQAFGGKAGGAIADLATRFGTFLSTAAASGKAVSWVQGALTVFKQLGTVAGNVGTIIANVFKAANDVGGGFLNNLGNITGQLAAFAKSAAGQAAISNVFTTLSAVASQLGPIVAALLTQLGGIAPLLAPLFQTIGPAITGVVNALGPAIQGIVPGVQALVSGLADGIKAIADSGALAAIGKALGGIGEAAAPLLPVIGDLVASLGTVLAPVLDAVVKAVTPVVDAFSDALAPVIPPLTDALLSIVTAVSPLLTLLGTTLAGVIRSAAPLLLTIAQTFGQIATAVAPLVTQLTEALVPVFAALSPIMDKIVKSLQPLITAVVNALLPALPPLIDAWVGMLNALLPLLPVVEDLVGFLVPLEVVLINVLAPVIAFAAEVAKWVTLGFTVPLIGGIVAALVGLVNGTKATINGISSFVTGTITLFTNLYNSVSGWVTRTVSAVVGIFGGLPGRVRAAVSAVTGYLGSVFDSARTTVADKSAALVTSAVNIIKRLPGQVRAGLGNLGSLLYSAGQDLIRGMINGVKSMAGALVDSAKSVVGGAVSGAKHLLGIHSPSTVFHEIGVNTGRGLINGLEAITRKVAQAAVAMTSRVVRPVMAGPVGVQPALTGLTAITQPFGASPTLGTNPSTRGRQSDVQSRPGVTAGSTSTATTIAPVFNITEVGDADATAERVVNRLVLAANVGF